jgi:hypothetical protein
MDEEGAGDMKRHMSYFFKHYGDIRSVSRKTKKAIIGTRISRKKLRERLATVVVTRNKYPEPATISDEFCPKCGCESSRTTENMAEYPEVWVKEFCLRCGFLLGMADNSPWVSCLEFPKEGYVIP